MTQVGGAAPADRCGPATSATGTASPDEAIRQITSYRVLGVTHPWFTRTHVRYGWYDGRSA